MKTLIFCLVISVTQVACQSGSDKSVQGQINKDSLNKSDMDHSAIPSSAVTDEMKPSLIKEIVISYMELKNALAEDNSFEAATSGIKLEAAFKNLDKSLLTEAQKKMYVDLEADAREHTGT